MQVVQPGEELKEKKDGAEQVEVCGCFTPSIAGQGQIGQQDQNDYQWEEQHPF
jgi:hypothetical protein